MELAHYLNDQTVLLASQAQNKEALLKEMVQLACEEGVSEAILKKVLEREAIKSTGFGQGLAVAHARVEKVTQFKVVLARPVQPLDWAAADQLPVQFVALVVGTVVQESLYLNVLAEISKLWSRKNVREALLSAQSVKELIQVILESGVRSHLRDE